MCRGRGKNKGEMDGKGERDSKRLVVRNPYIYFRGRVMDLGRGRPVFNLYLSCGFGHN